MSAVDKFLEFVLLSTIILLFVVIWVTVGALVWMGCAEILA